MRESGGGEKEGQGAGAGERKRGQSHILYNVLRGVHPVNKKKSLPGIKELQEHV